MVHSHEEKFEKEVYETLLKLGYPQDSVLIESPIISKDGSKLRPDLLIVDPARSERLAVIEIKSSLKFDYVNVVEKLRKYVEAAGNNVPAYLVTPSGVNGGGVKIYLYSFDREAKLSELSVFPSYVAMKAEAQIERKEDLRNEKANAVDNFKIACWSMALVVLLIVIADVFLSLHGFALLTTERMALLGAVVALIAIPYAQKFKGLGMEWERVVKDDKTC
ncbi:hypothetical protein [Pseudomonas helleri]|uniref:hypothetical protein n=1 Tax=Pseudomonas helleri TaxID=1608996 RepID=UPI003827AD92